MERHINKFVTVWAVCLTAFLIMGLTIPNTFTAGTTISAAEMNANFAAVKTAVDALESPTRRGTVLLFGRVRGELATPDFDTGAYTSDGSPLPAITDLGVGNYTVALPNGEVFDHGNHAVSITPMEFGSSRMFTIEQGAGGTIEVSIWDDAGNRVDEDFQIIVFND